MCPFVALLFFFQLFYLFCDVASVTIHIRQPIPAKKDGVQELKIIEHTSLPLSFQVSDYDQKIHDSQIKIMIRDTQVANVNQSSIDLYQIADTTFHNISLKGNKVGFTKLDLVYVTNGQVDEKSRKTIDVLTVFDQNTLLSTIFTVMVAVLVSLNLVNMGCALDIGAVKETLKRPTALLIGFFTHYFFMPLLAFFIGQFLFEDVPYLRLSLFIFGCSPGGSAANMWTVLLGGNLNLSVTLTFISTLFAILMMPLWLFTLGIQIFKTTSIQIPYRNILTSLFTLVISISIGLAIQKYKPKIAQKSKKILAPVSGFLIVFIVIFASISYWYLFKLMSWQIILASTLNVWFGFAIGAIFAAILKQPFQDLISIMVETGVQNTGIVFIVLRMALTSPYQDYAMTIPIAASCVTAIPLGIIFIVMKCRKNPQKKTDSNQEIFGDETTPIRINGTSNS